MSDVDLAVLIAKARHRRCLLTVTLVKTGLFFGVGILILLSGNPIGLAPVCFGGFCLPWALVSYAEEGESRRVLKGVRRVDRVARHKWLPFSTQIALTEDSENLRFKAVRRLTALAARQIQAERHAGGLAKEVMKAIDAFDRTYQACCDFGLLRGDEQERIDIFNEAREELDRMSSTT